MVLLCRELGSFLSRINRYAFISGGQHRKLRHTGYSYFMQTWIQTTLSGQECTLERLACFSTPLFFFNRGSKHNFVTYISRCERNEERNVISSFFLYKIPLRNDGSYVRFLSRRRQRTGSSFHYETYLVRVNSLNTISENYVHRYLF